MSEPALKASRPSQMHGAHLQGVCDPIPALRDLPPSGSARVSKLIKRGFLLQCPYCGTGGIIKFPFWIADCCPSCGYRFAPESGYFVGGYALNLIGAEVIGLIAVIVVLLRSNLSLYQQEALGIGAAILLPVVFFPWSRTLWMALDLTFQGDLHLEQERRITAQQEPGQTVR